MGADSLVRSLFFGPGPALEWCRSARETGGLLEEVWAEGGALLDLDARRLTFFQRHIPYHPELRRFLLPLMQTNWPGWELRWANRGVVELAELLGQDVSIQLSATENWWYEPPKMENPPEFIQTLLTLREPGGVRDLGFWDSLTNLLAMGPCLFDSIEDWPLADVTSRESLEETLIDIEEGAYLDRVERRMSAWSLCGSHERHQDIFRSRWPGWTIDFHHEGLPGQFARSSRDPAQVSLGENGILRQIVGLLTEDTTFEPRDFLDHLRARGEEIEWVHPDFLKTDPPAIVGDERASLLARSIADYRRSRPG